VSREQHSAEHLNGGSYYRAWTTEELIEEYAWEAKRISREDAERTKRSIKAELKRRFNATLELLDDEQTEESPEGTYRYLLGV
jgi:hypothetical protein